MSICLKVSQKVFIALTALTLIVIVIKTNSPTQPTYLFPIFEKDILIDVVYTWVNGSDPEFIRQLFKYLPNNEYHQPQRYIENHEIKYSLRSIEKYAPWVRDI